MFVTMKSCCFLFISIYHSYQPLKKGIVGDVQIDHGQRDHLCKMCLHLHIPYILLLTTGFPAEPGNPGDLNFIYPSPEIAWNFSQKMKKRGQNTNI